VPPPALKQMLFDRQYKRLNSQRRRIEPEKLIEKPSTE